MAVWDRFDPFDPAARAFGARSAARIADGLQRAAPAAGAAALHAAGVAALIWFAGTPRIQEAQPHVVTVELVAPPPEPVREPEPAPDRQAPASAPGPDTRPAAQALSPVAAPQPTAPAGSQAAPPETVPDEAVLDAPGGAPGETAIPTRSSALRGLACARAFGRGTDIPGCEGAEAWDGEAFGFARYGDGADAAQVDAAVTARFGALAGLYGAQLDPSLRRLPGQQGTEVFVNRRMGLSGADQMRDSLPPMVPDPAFGD